MISFKLAFRNLMGAGLRTWLNVAVLSLSFVIIIFYNGLIEGWNIQARTDTIEWEIGAGQLWHPEYDPLDMYSFQDSHASLSADLENLVKQDILVPVLVTQATAYPEGRMQSILLKGIDPDQNRLKLPTELLHDPDGFIPVIIGRRMAKTLKMGESDELLIRWRDTHGTFDAREVKIAGVFHTNVPNIDNGQLWLPLDRLQEMLMMPGEATYLVIGEKNVKTDIGFWVFKDTDFLLADIDKIIQSKKGGAAVIYVLLLIIALLAIFDTQVLSIFRRQKEIGTYIAMGMIRWQVIRIFTIEGSMYSLFAILLSGIYGIPIFYYLSKYGLAFPISTTDMGLTIAERMYPVYSLGLIVSSIILVVTSATIVSFLPARKISKMNATDAIKGKIQ